ncbi:MAG: hypothetical protein II876_04815 [Synergistaceae bacterium]|nr:hypothetical protein [Synergistaceae bacterium]MBQ3758766.1 hypothetical protein [Synergistaceae bacterium]
MKTRFEAVQCYEIGAKPSGRDIPFVFRYERKEGIHHMFREATGGWRRTYTEAQLIGKKIKEVYLDSKMKRFSVIYCYGKHI